MGYFINLELAMSSVDGPSRTTRTRAIAIKLEETDQDRKFREQDYKQKLFIFYINLKDTEYKNCQRIARRGHHMKKPQSSSRPKNLPMR